MRYCSNCNTILPDDSEFCTNCGAKITSPANDTKEVTKKGLKLWQILLIVLSVILVIGISVGATYLFMKSDAENNDDSGVVNEDEDDDKDKDDSDDKKPDSDDDNKEPVDVIVPDVDYNKKTEIVIGVSGPLTGPAAYYGNSVLNGAQLAVDEINAAGGINGGIQLKLVTADDEADTGEKAVSAYNSLKDQGMQIFLGPVTSGSAFAVINETYNDNLFQLTPSASANDVIRNDNCFQICFTDSNQGARSAQYIAENKLATKVGIIYDSSDAYSSGIFNQFINAAAELNLEIVAEEAFTKDSNKDFTAQIHSCKVAGADLIFLPIYYTEASLILHAADSADYWPRFFGCDGLDGILGIENFDISLAEGMMLLTPFAADADDNATIDFVAAYKAKYNYEIPNQFAADAYDGVYVIAKLIEENKITADMSASEICDILKEKICSDGFSYAGVTGAGSDLTWDRSGAVSKKPMAIVIRNGVYTAY